MTAVRWIPIRLSTETSLRLGTTRDSQGSIQFLPESCRMGDFQSWQLKVDEGCLNFRVLTSGVSILLRWYIRGAGTATTLDLRMPLMEGVVLL